MSHSFVVNRPLSLPLTIILLSAACSDSSNTDRGGGGSTVAASELRPQTASVSTTASTTSAWPDYSWVAALQVAPRAQCNVYPQGTDPSKSDLISAFSDGYIRFYMPPPSWGTKLTVDCSVNEPPLGQYLIDLNDSTTFVRQSVSDVPSTSSTRPGLTGDLSTISPQTLSQQGYPPRPDPTVVPKWYATWAQSVSKPWTSYELAPIAGLGMMKLNGTSACQEASCDTSGQEPWTGVVQAAAGFVTSCPEGFPETNNPGSNNQLYIEYASDLFIPSPSNDGSCGTGIWQGIGGFPASNGTGGYVESSLIQHGFWLTGSGASNVQFVWEWINSSGNGPPNYHPLIGNFNLGDEVELAGYGATNTACTANGASENPSYSCALWYDLTTNANAWAYTSNPGGTYKPSSVEYVAEVPSGSPGNCSYGNVLMTGLAYDWNGGTHYNPPVTGQNDPYQFVQQYGCAGGLCGEFSTVTWGNGTGCVQNPEESGFLEFLIH